MQGTDEELYRVYRQRGEQEALRCLFDRYSEGLMLFLCGYTRSIEDAEELMIDSFAEVAAGTNIFSGKSSFKTWLFSVGKHQALMLIRKQKHTPVPMQSEPAELRKTEGPVEWTVTENGKTLMAAWASETEVLLENDDVVLTLWFAKKEGTAPGVAQITFTVNALGNASELSLLFAGRVLAAEAHTVDGSIIFEAIVYGDANCDGQITAADAALILRTLVGLSELTPRGLLHADVDGNGEITAADAALILRYVIRLIDSFPAENP